MKVLVSEQFHNRELPDGWLTESHGFSFCEAGLSSGSQLGLVVPLPGREWQSLRVELTVQTEGGWIYCAHDGVETLTIDLRTDGYPRHRAADGQHVLAETTFPISSHDQVHQVVFDLERECLAATVDGNRLVAVGNPRHQLFSGDLHLSFRDHCTVREVRVLGKGPVVSSLEALPPRRNEDFGLEVAVDFPDDLIRTHFTQQMLDDMFGEFKVWGVRRVHWVHVGKQSEGLWDHFPLGIAANAASTVARMGEIFPAAVRAAHRHDLEIFGLMKPFDMGFRWSHGESTPQATDHGRLPRIGGPVSWITHFSATHRELVMARRPDAWGEARNRTWTRIDLVKEDDRASAVEPDDLSLWVSNDNTTYRRYTGPLHYRESIEEYPLYVHTPSGARPTKENKRCRVLCFDGLNICEKYVALQVTGGQCSFVNSLMNLFHVFGEKGEETNLTYAVMPRQNDRGQALPFQEAGLEYDRFPGTPTSGFGGGYDAICEPLALDAGTTSSATSWSGAGAGTGKPTAILAVARGKEPGTLAALSPSFPETRQWWLCWVQDMLDAGADGVDFRLGNHHADFAWGEYGFEPPVRDLFLQRHGIDIWATDDFDRTAWRYVRGEAYTQFLREARDLVKKHGKLFGMHIEPQADAPAEIGGGMNIHWDWRAWITELQPDSVTAKGVIPGSRLANELLALTRPRGIPVTGSYYAINLFTDYMGLHPREGGERAVNTFIKRARNVGYDSFQFYEGASVVAGTTDEKIIMLEPGLRRIFQKHFTKRETGTLEHGKQQL